jgi:hypothetical protein
MSSLNTNVCNEYGRRRALGSGNRTKNLSPDLKPEKFENRKSALRHPQRFCPCPGVGGKSSEGRTLDEDDEMK